MAAALNTKCAKFTALRLIVRMRKTRSDNRRRSPRLSRHTRYAQCEAIPRHCEVGCESLGSLGIRRLRYQLADVGVLLPPVVVLFLLFRGTLINILVGTVGFNLPLVVNHGLILCRLDASLPSIALGLAAGGQHAGRQRGAQQARTEFSRGH